MGWPVKGEHEPVVIRAYGKFFERCSEDRKAGIKRLHEGMERERKRLEGIGIRYTLDKAQTT